MSFDKDVLVSVNDVNVTLGAAHILRGVSFQVHRGEVVAIMGANGSGKSTLMKTLIGVHHPSSGTVQMPPRNAIGYVPQRVAATGGLPATAQEVVASGLLGKRRLGLGRGWQAEVQRALGMVGLADRANSATIHLSGGQQQRVLIARALVRHPELLIMDEPVAGVDQPTQRQFAATLKTLIDSGITIIVVLHELGELEPLITRAVVLRAGQVIYDGPPPRSTAEHAEPGHQHVHHPGQDVDALPPDESGFTSMQQPMSALTKHRRGGGFETPLTLSVVPDDAAVGAAGFTSQPEKFGPKNFGQEPNHV
jgi:zinc transport system ATP-binding protein